MQQEGEIIEPGRGKPDEHAGNRTLVLEFIEGSCSGQHSRQSGSLQILVTKAQQGLEII